MNTTNNLPKRITAALAACVIGAAPVAAAVNLNVDWKDKDSYTDLGTNFDDTSVKRFSKEIEEYLKRIAPEYLPDGSTLTMTVTNVDLAGEIEPWHINNDVRIVRDIYPPKMTFEYMVERGNGEVIKEGTARLADLDFNYNIGRRVFADDEFFYEKEMLGEWIRTELDVK